MIRSLLLIFLLSSCSTTSLNIFSFDAFRAFFGSEFIITDEIFNNTKYSFARVRIGRSNSILMVLLSRKDGIYEWISSDGAKIYTLNGKIIRVDGLTNSLLIRSFSSFDFNHSQTYFIDLYGPTAIDLGVNSNASKSDISKVEILFKEVLLTSLVIEKFQVSEIGWKGTNLFYFDEKGRHRLSIQEVHPKLPKIRFEVIKPASL